MKRYAYLGSGSADIFGEPQGSGATLTADGTIVHAIGEWFNTLTSKVNSGSIGRS